MTVGSFIELYTTLIGWAFYNNLWDVLAGAGIVFLPFIGLVIRHFTEPAKSMEPGEAAAASLRRMEIDVALALSVIVLAAQPVLVLNPSSLAYQKPCSGTTAGVGASGTTFDATLGGAVIGGGGTIDVPLWWYGILAVSGGMNHALIGGFTCVADLRAVNQAARSVSFKDPNIRREYDRFASECYVPALSQYNREQPNTPAVQTLLNHYGADDLAWIGSHVYLETPGYYDKFRAVRPVPGYPYDPARDTEYDASLPPPHGRPTCKEWWEGGAGGPAGGLRQRLIDEAGFFDQAKLAIMSTLGGSFWSSYDDQQLGDALIKDLQANGPPNFTGTGYGGSWAPAASVGGATVAGGVGAAVAGAPVIAGAALATGAAAVSLASDMAGYYTTMYLVREAAPIAQALVLMAIYAFLPLIIVFSGYSIPIMVMGAIGILTVRFWSVLWMLAWWLDQYLLAAMYPDPETFFGPGSWGLERVLLDMVIAALYIGLPFVFTIVMGWGGYQVGNAINSVSRSLIDQTSDIGGRAASSATKTGGNRAFSGKKK